jgi:hypothetical protein
MIAALVASLAAFVAGPSSADSITARRADGRRVEVTGIAIDPRSAASLTTAAGGVESVPLADLVAVEFPARSPAARAPAALTVLLHDGSRIVGDVQGGDEERLDFLLAGAARVAIPVDSIRAVFAGPRAAFLDVERFARAGDGDSLHRRPDMGGDYTRGTLAAFSAEGVRFEYSLGTGLFPWSELEAVILAKQVENEEPAPPVVEADLRPDGTLRGTLVHLTEQELVLAPGGFPARVALPRRELEALRFEGERHAWLSDLKPARVTQVPYLGSEAEFLFPWRADRSVTGRPLLVRGRRFGKGFGCHSRTTLSFDLDGRFSRFEAEVGVSDEVLELPDHGAIEFRVLVDGEERFRSRALRGGEPAEPVGPIELSGAKRFELVTDFGPGEDVADRGVWGCPLLLR